MKTFNVHDESTNENQNTKNTTNSSKQTSASRLQDLSGKMEETKSSNTETPNPKKAPLNYIDNMWEWEDAQKKYVEDVAKKQQELVTILWVYEDKTEETDRFRTAKSDLENRLVKTMWSIVNKLKDYDAFLLQVYKKLFSQPEWENLETPETEETSNEETVSEDITESEEEINEEWSKNENETDEELEDENWNKDWDEETDEETEEDARKSILDILQELWVEFNLIPISAINQGTWKWELLDDAKEIITRFLSVRERGNWDKYKQLLDKTEIEWMDNLHNSIKKNLDIYLELLYQIDLIDAKIDKLENEESTLYSKYYQWVKEAKKMEEDMEKLNETYFLNSYLSTKNVSLDNFVSDPLVEKQIQNIIELNKHWKPIPKTILLYWSLNSWKTYAANVLASELWRKMYHIKSYDIFTWWFSDPNAMLDTIFTWAIKKKEPCIIFLDEIESFAQSYDGSAYKDLLENTIRHHVSKIKESNLDIMVIWAISDKNKVSKDLFKQDVFSKQIYFTWLSKERSEVLFNKMIEEKGINLWDDVNIHKFFEKKIKNLSIDHEYMKKIISFAIDFHKLNESWDSDNITLSQNDLYEAIDFMFKHLNSSKVWYYLQMMNT